MNQNKSWFRVSLDRLNLNMLSMKCLDCPYLIPFLAVGQRDAWGVFAALQLENSSKYSKSLFRCNADRGKVVWLVSVGHLGHNFPFYLQTQQESPTWTWPTLRRAEFGPDWQRPRFRSDDAHEVSPTWEESLPLVCPLGTSPLSWLQSVQEDHRRLLPPARGCRQPGLRPMPAAALESNQRRSTLYLHLGRASWQKTDRPVLFTGLSEIQTSPRHALKTHVNAWPCSAFPLL